MGKNFGAVSCEPCKSFFRRNSLKINLICHFDNNCKIDVITRKYCSKCRLDKCLAIGMRRDWIINDEERELKRPKTMTNKIQRNSLNNSINNEPNNDHGQNTTLYSSQETSCIENHISITSISDTDFLCEIFDNNFTIDALNEQIVNIETSVRTNDCIDSQTNHISKDNNQNSDNYTQNLLTHYYSPESVGEKVVLGYEMPVIPIGRPIDDHKSDFNETEIYIITELIQSTEFRSFGTTSFDNYVRNVSQAVKGLTAFNTICEDDRILLLKYSCIEVIFLRSILCLNDTADYLRLQRTPTTHLHAFTSTLFITEISVRIGGKDPILAIHEHFDGTKRLERHPEDAYFESFTEYLTTSTRSL
ncbi:unnamed protein product [Medioppia subpectinata]|uniref:Nuclear receptor domain-containing protein n=1 Tax=Medioppia subpectinata TaxID=1979941 RepID=A0A7R9PTL9_9ACAR|nr:unnamed protein product [Medioppia subpectinata]CAG2100790.1 unnamed protein product [Medioppia subpectinata]